MKIFAGTPSRPPRRPPPPVVPPEAATTPAGGTGAGGGWRTRHGLEAPGVLQELELEGDVPAGRPSSSTGELDHRGAPDVGTDDLLGGDDSGAGVRAHEDDLLRRLAKRQYSTATPGRHSHRRPGRGTTGVGGQTGGDEAQPEHDRTGACTSVTEATTRQAATKAPWSRGTPRPGTVARRRGASCGARRPPLRSPRERARRRTPRWCRARRRSRERDRRRQQRPGRAARGGRVVAGWMRASARKKTPSSAIGR
jgi:hypothetical protein